MDFLIDKGVDLVVGVIAAIVGVAALFVIARPRLIFGHGIRVTRPGEGDSRPTRYGLIFDNRRLLWLSRMHAEVSLEVRYPGGTTTSVPVPLSRSDWVNVRRRKGLGWRGAPRLLVDEIQWHRHVRSANDEEMHGLPLPEAMHKVNAALYLRVTAKSAVFGVEREVVRSYEADELVYGPFDHPLTEDVHEQPPSEKS